MKKKKKFNLIKDVHNNFYEETQKNKKLLEDALQDENFRYFSTQGNINPTTTVTENTQLNENNNINNQNDSFLKSLDRYDSQKNKNKRKKSTISNSSYDSRSSKDENLSILIDHLKKEHNSHIFSESESIISNSEESIIKHLKKCSKCKSKIQLVFDDNHHKKKYDDNSDVKSNSLTIKFSDLKEYMIIILLGFLIVLIIYIFFKFK